MALAASSAGSAADAPTVLSGLRVVAIFHEGGTTGTSEILRPSLELITRRGELEVVIPRGGAVPRAYEAIATIVSLPYRRMLMPGTTGGSARAALRLGSDLRVLRRHIRAQRPDLVVVATGTLPAALLAARLEDVPVIVEVDEIFDKGHVRGAGRALAARAASELHGRLADALVCCSRTVAAQFQGGGGALVSPSYPGISREHGEGDGGALRRRLGIQAAHPLVAVVGNITAGRGQDLVIRALPTILERFAGAVCVVAGRPHDRRVDLEYRADLDRLAQTIGVAGAVLFPGFLERVADLYAAADVLVNPARFNEPFGRMAPEALMAGCPVVAAAVGGIPEVLRDGRDALLVGPDDPTAIARAVVRLAEDRPLATRLARQGRERVVREFREDRAAAHFARVAESVMSASGEALEHRGEVPAPAISGFV